MPRTEEQFESIREERKSQICRAALELFANKGYHSTSISLIAKQANISKGLMYNYFKSKEDLLQTIFVDLTENMMAHLNPTKDSHIPEKMSEKFIETLIDVIVTNPSDWKLFYQIFMQQDIMEVMMKESMMENFLYAQQTMFNYFADREFEDIHLTILHFSSLYKGFGLQYALAPEMFTKDDINKLKMLFRDLFVKPLRKNNENRLELTESLGYMLL